MKKIMTYFTLMTVLFCIFICKGFALDESKIIIQKLLDNHVSSPSDIISNMQESLEISERQARADCPEDYSCNIEDLQPLISTTWEFTVVENGTPYEYTLVFTAIPTNTSSGSAVLDFVYQIQIDSAQVVSILGATFYRDLSQIMGGGYGFAAMVISGDYVQTFFFRITDNLASGVYVVDNITDQDPPSALPTTGRCISSKGGDINGDGKIGLEEAVNALKIVSGSK